MQIVYESLGEEDVLLISRELRRPTGKGRYYKGRYSIAFFSPSGLMAHLALLGEKEVTLDIYLPEYWEEEIRELGEVYGITVKEDLTEVDLTGS